MDIIIKKFGGTSLRDINKSDYFLSHIKESIANNIIPVIVVSAIGRKGEAYATDTLIETLESINVKIEPEKKDLIMSCGEIIAAGIVSHFLDSNGIPSKAFTGLQAGIITDDNFNSANILNINVKNILNSINQNIVPVIAGFQGATKDLEITTLGRGGSDITAVSLGGYLKAKKVEIFTDVPGVAIIDPNIISSTKYISNINYDDMYILASNGVNVIHPKAIKLAKDFNIPVEIKSTFTKQTGTKISNSKATDSRLIVGVGINIENNIGIITIVFNKDFNYNSIYQFEKYLLENEDFINSQWKDNNILNITTELNGINYFSEKIYQYFSI